MLTNDERFRLGNNGPQLSAPPGLLARIVASLATAALLVVAFMFSILIFTAIAAIALVAGIYLWWKTRALRRQLRERPFGGGRIIDGEVIHDAEADAHRR